MVHPWEVDVTCPLCGQRTRMLKLVRHAKKRHADLTPAQFEAVVLEAMTSGKMKFDTRRAAPTGDMTSATNLLRRSIYTGNPDLPASGGAFSLGRRR
jgi:hypothetical protein